MHILFAASECFPFVKIGGLADVVGGLPKALEQNGIDVSIIIPAYQEINLQLFNVELSLSKFTVDLGLQKEEVVVHRAKLPGTEIPVYFLENKSYLSSGSIYANQEFHPQEEIARFVFFSQAVFNFINQPTISTGLPVDIVHCHDWHTSLIPLLISSSPLKKKPKTILTIHNLGKAYQGTGDFQTLENFGIERKSIVIKNEETQANLLLQGIMYSDLITTVSQTYAQEIKTQEFGEDLESYLIERSADLYGILNGIDGEIWDPRKDKVLPFPFTDNLSASENKKLNADTLLTQLGMTSTDGQVIMGMVTRIAEQKGFDILMPILEELLQNGALKLIILGVGDNNIEASLEEIALEHDQNFRFLKRFDEYFAHLIYASSDLFLMPSRFEPSGIGQLIAMNYGTLPLVRKVGGLADSVTDQKTGFVFEKYQSQVLLEKIKEAVNVVKANKELYEKMVQSAMQQDFSWTKSAKEYLKLYKKLIS